MQKELFLLLTGANNTSKFFICCSFSLPFHITDDEKGITEADLGTQHLDLNSNNLFLKTILGKALVKYKFFFTALSCLVQISVNIWATA